LEQSGYGIGNVAFGKSGARDSAVEGA